MGKTTLAKLLTKTSYHTDSDPTKEIQKFFGTIKLESSLNSSFFTLERWRKYKLNIIDVPGSFEERRHWRDAFKKGGKKPYAVVLVVDPFQSIPETQSVLEEIYNQYLESLSKNLEKADNIAHRSYLLILIVMNHFVDKGEFDETEFYEAVFREILKVIRKKIPLLLVDKVSINLKNYPENYYDLNSILERIQRYYFNQIKK